jgi:hypothetical protein
MINYIIYNINLIFINLLSYLIKKLKFIIFDFMETILRLYNPILKETKSKLNKSVQKILSPKSTGI